MGPARTAAAAAPVVPGAAAAVLPGTVPVVPRCRNTLLATGPVDEVRAMVADIDAAPGHSTLQPDLRRAMNFRSLPDRGADPHRRPNGRIIELPGGLAQTTWAFETDDEPLWSDLGEFAGTHQLLDLVLTHHSNQGAGVEHFAVCPSLEYDDRQGEELLDLATYHPGGNPAVLHTIDLRHPGAAGDLTTRPALLELFATRLADSLGDHYVVVLGDDATVAEAYGLGTCGGTGRGYDLELGWTALSDLTLVAPQAEWLARRVAQAGAPLLAGWWRAARRTGRGWPGLLSKTDVTLVFEGAPDVLGSLTRDEQSTLVTLAVACTANADPASPAVRAATGALLGALPAAAALELVLEVPAATTLGGAAVLAALTAAVTDTAASA